MNQRQRKAYYRQEIKPRLEDFRYSGAEFLALLGIFFVMWALIVVAA